MASSRPSATDPGLALRLLQATAEDMAALQAVLERAPRYFELVQGAPPGPAEAQSTYTALPAGKGYEDKYVWGLDAGGAMIGCADVIRGWNVPDKAMIGLLLLAEPWQGRGIGRTFVGLVEEAVAQWPEITTLRIGVVVANGRARRFWEGLGYRPTGEIRPPRASLHHPVEVLEKAVAYARGPRP